MKLRKAVRLLLVLLFIGTVVLVGAVVNYSVTLPSWGTIQSSNPGPLTYLHTEGNKIKDGNGNVVQLRGENWADLVDHFEYDSAWLPMSRAKNAKNSGATVIGVKFAIDRLANIPGNVWYDAYTQASLDEAVNAALQNNLYVILVPHIGWDPTFSLGEWLVGTAGNNFQDNHWAQYVDILANLAGRYASNPAFAGIYFWNEPQWMPGVTEATYFQWVRTWINAVHAKNPNAIAVFSHIDYASIPENAETLVPPSQYSNFMWAFHHYYRYDRGNLHWDTYNAGDFTLARQQYEDYLLNERGLNQINRNLFPIIDDEFGYLGRTSLPAPNNDPLDPSYFYYEPAYDKLGMTPQGPGPMEAELQIYDEYGISWVSYVGGTYGGYDYGLWDSIGDSATPSDKGLVWKTHLAASPPPPPPPPPPPGNWTQVLSTGFEAPTYPLGTRYLWDPSSPRPQGFADNDVSDPNGAYIQVVNTQVHGGTQALYHYAPRGNPQDPMNTETWANLIWINEDGVAPKGLRVSFWIRFGTFPGNFLSPFYFNDIVTYEKLMQLNLDGSGNLGLGYLYIYPEQALTQVQRNRWYQFELWYVIDAVNGEMGVKVDGQTLWSVSNANTSGLPVVPLGFEFGVYNPSQSEDHYLWTDDMVVSIIP